MDLQEDASDIAGTSGGVKQNVEGMLQEILTQVQLQKSEIQELVDSKISDLKQEIHGNSLSVASEVKKIKSSSEVVWKRQGNKLQFQLNSDLSDSLTQALWGIDNNKCSYTRELIGDVLKKLKQRNKLIRLADTSEGGWETVKQYETNPVASDSDDESRINKAENRALRKRKTKFQQFQKGKKQKSFPSYSGLPVSDMQSTSSMQSAWRMVLDVQI